MTSLRAAKIASFILLLSGIVVAAIAMQGNSALEHANARADAGAPATESVANYRAAALWRLPWSQSSFHALSSLRELGENATREGNAQVARAAWQAIYSVESQYTLADAPRTPVALEAAQRLAHLGQAPLPRTETPALSSRILVVLGGTMLLLGLVGSARLAEAKLGQPRWVRSMGFLGACLWLVGHLWH